MQHKGFCLYMRIYPIVSWVVYENVIKTSWFTKISCKLYVHSVITFQIFNFFFLFMKQVSRSSQSGYVKIPKWKEIFGSNMKAFHAIWIHPQLSHWHVFLIVGKSFNIWCLSFPEVIFSLWTREENRRN